jgi:hypothetical protein
MKIGRTGLLIRHGLPVRASRCTLFDPLTACVPTVCEQEEGPPPPSLLRTQTNNDSETVLSCVTERSR